VTTKTPISYSIFIFYAYQCISQFLILAREIAKIEEVHSPYFLAFPPSNMDCEKVRKEVIKKFEGDGRVKKMEK